MSKRMNGKGKLTKLKIVVDKNHINDNDIDLDTQAIANLECGEYKLNVRNLKLIKNLGSGNYGSVDLKRHTPSETILAVKQIQISEEDKKNLKREIHVLKLSVTCPNVVRFYGAFFQDGTAFICMEAMDMCLTKFYEVVFKRMLLPHMPESVLGAVTVCVLTALHFLKKNLNVIHRDVKPSNVLINNKGEIKICDFGISGCLIDSRVKSYVGCLKYMAPELFDTEHITKDGYDIRSDVWSLGITLLEISSGISPFQEFNTPYLFMNFLTRNDPPSPSTNYSEQFINLISLCLQRNFQLRPFYHDLLQHGFSIHHQNSVNDDNYINFVQNVLSKLSSPT